MLLIVHQFAVSKLDENVGKEEASEISPEGFEEGFDDESLVSILDSYELKEKDIECDVSKDNEKVKINEIRKRQPPKLVRKNFASKKIKFE